MARTHRTVASAILSLIVAALGIVLFSSSSAQAAPGDCYPVDNPDCPADVAISDTVVPQGGVVSITATGFDAGTPATGVVRSEPIPAGTKTVAPDGSVSFSVELPENFEPGQHRFEVRGIAEGSSIMVFSTFTVVADEAGAGGADDGAAGGLPATGSDSNLTTMAGIGIGFLALGGLAVYFGRRRAEVTTG